MTIRVLIADDHVVMQDGLQLLLKQHTDLQVCAVTGNGLEIGPLCKEHRPDVVLMDIAMPGRNGIDATREALSASPHTRVVILSMYSTLEHIQSALQAGARGYLLKECAGREVVDAVRAVHAGHRYLSQPVTDLLLENFGRTRDVETQGSLLARLSERERQVLQRVAAGKTSAEIGQELGLSPNSVNTYRWRMMQKLGVSSLSALVRFAIEHNI